MDETKSGADLIADERQRQIDVEGYTPEHDALEGSEGALALAAAVYALPAEARAKTPDGTPVFWPWSRFYWKPTPDDRVRELVKAGALIAAEIDRLQAVSR